MEKEKLHNFEDFLANFTKRSGRKLGERTIHGILTLSKFIEPTQLGKSQEELTQIYK